MARNNLPSSYRKLHPDMWADIRHRYESGVPPRILIQEYGLPDSTFYKRRKVEGWTVSSSTKALQSMDVAHELLSIELSVERVEEVLDVSVVATEFNSVEVKGALPEVVSHR